MTSSATLDTDWSRKSDGNVGRSGEIVDPRVAEKVASDSGAGVDP